MLDAVIVGAGPYGLSIAAHFRHSGIAFRIFGRLMDTWMTHMPKGMMLKSDGFASNLYDPENRLTLEKFCLERGIEYAHTGIPVRLDTFNAYGRAFRDRLVPELEDALVTRIERRGSDFAVQLDSGEVVLARRVVLAVGITHFEYMPETLAPLPPENVSHSARHHELTRFRNRRVLVVGAGGSALDLAGLLRVEGADVEVIARAPEVRFHTKPTGRPRSRWQQIRHPQSGLGPGLRSRFFCEAPHLFHYLPERLRITAVRRALGPSGGWFTRDMVLGRVPLLLGYTVTQAVASGNQVRLELKHASGETREVEGEHVIAATGYRVNVDRLQFLSDGIRSKLRTVHRTPLLSSQLESSVPGLYFVGIAAANGFGPVMRFAFGAGFAARRLTGAFNRSLVRERASISASRLLADSE